jgi:dTDP-4-amino-4,6-dideoxygalactose transaminase
MIPRLKPAFDTAEIGAALRGGSAADVAQFERAFAGKFEAAEAIAFPYGRTALKALLHTLELKDAEVIAPSYTCVVVQHATVLSGNVPVFVDNTMNDYNMDLDRLAAAITPHTGMILATHLFGFPLDLDRFDAIVRDAEQRFGRKIWVVQDCAHAFGARWRGRLVAGAGDAALFGLNISKLISSGAGLARRQPDAANRGEGGAAAGVSVGHLSRVPAAAVRLRSLPAIPDEGARPADEGLSPG